MHKFFSTAANFQTGLGLNTIFLVIINLEELRNAWRYFNFELVLWVDDTVLTNSKDQKFLQAQVSLNTSFSPAKQLPKQLLSSKSRSSNPLVIFKLFGNRYIILTDENNKDKY